jgi:uncharacterized peroxidase-related enzyme
MTPNFIRVLANAPAALQAFLGLYAIAGQGALDIAARERIALAVAEQNACQYCIAAHTAIGRSVGLDDAEMEAARRGEASDAKSAAAVGFARALVESTGEVSSLQFETARAALTEEEIVEVIAHVALNLFTNILGKATQVDIDFPQVSRLMAA